MQQTLSQKRPYVSRQPDAAGRVQYSDDDHRVWAELYARQSQAIRDTACREFQQGLDLLQLPRDQVPQLTDVSRVLHRETGWQIAAVPALISASEFFHLLSQRRFPSATFVRRRDELDYLQEPDIFHELFGHAPMLANPYFAQFNETYGRLGLAANDEQREFLARLYWFTVEFGLIQSTDGATRIYGGGILSSIGETDYALGTTAQRRRFSVMDVLRTPYRIDIMQPVYYVIHDLRELYELAQADLMHSINQAQSLGLYAPTFPAHPRAA